MKDDKLYLIHMLERTERIQTYTSAGKEAFLNCCFCQIQFWMGSITTFVVLLAVVAMTEIEREF